MILGMADTSGAYASFIATPFATRDGSQLLIRTPDQRLPQGATRAAQQRGHAVRQHRHVVHAGPLFRQPVVRRRLRGRWFRLLEYDHKRWLAIYRASGVGPMVQFPKAENDMLAAEGDIYAGNFCGGAGADRRVAREARPGFHRHDHQRHAADSGRHQRMRAAGSAGADVRHRRVRDDPRGHEVGKAHGDGVCDVRGLVPSTDVGGVIWCTGCPRCGRFRTRKWIPARSRSTTWVVPATLVRPRQGTYGF